MTDVLLLNQAFADADAAWAALVNETFPKVPDARYLPIARGAPGTELRRLYEARLSAMERWRSAMHGAA